MGWMVDSSPVVPGEGGPFWTFAISHRQLLLAFAISCYELPGLIESHYAKRTLPLSSQDTMPQFLSETLLFSHSKLKKFSPGASPKLSPLHFPVIPPMSSSLGQDQVGTTKCDRVALALQLGTNGHNSHIALFAPKTIWV